MAADVEHAGGAEPKAKIFISYSRKDMAFVDRLEPALKSRGFEPLIDRAEIYAFEDWWKRIEALISRSDTVVFVLSPDAVTSDVALKEVAHAAALNKRFAPIVYRQVNDTAIPEALRRLNFIFFDDRARFDASSDQLANALRTNIGWIRQHTEFGEAARRWAAAGRPGPRGLLLRSPILEEAERWIAARPEGAPPPTEAAQTFVTESRRAATQRRNLLSGSLGTGLLIALVLAGLAYWQRGIAVEQGDLAQRQHITTLAELATSERLRGNLDVALRLSAHAVRLGIDRNESEIDQARPRSALAAAEWQVDWSMLVPMGGDYAVSVAFSSDGSRFVTASGDKTAAIWAAATGQQIAVLRGHADAVNTAAFSADGTRIVTASRDNTARIWDAASAETIHVLRGHSGAVRWASFSPDGTRVVTASYDKTARIWDTASGKELAVIPGDQHGLESAVFSPDGLRIVTASAVDGVIVWDAANGSRLMTMAAGGAQFAAFSPDGARVASAEVEMARIWDAATGKEIGKEIMALRGHTDTVRSINFSLDGSRVLTASDDGTARIWETATGKVLLTFVGHEKGVLSAALSNDGKHVITASRDRTVRTWNAIPGGNTAILGGRDDGVRSAVFSPDGSLVLTASLDGTARLWNVADAQLKMTLNGYLSVVCAAFSHDGSRILTAEDGWLRIWDAATGKQISVIDLSAHNGLIQSAAFSPDDSRIVTASWDQTARVWDVRTGKQIFTLAGHDGMVWSAAFSADGLRIVTASWDKTARVWDSVNGKEIMVLRGHDFALNSAAFSPDGTRIVTASSDKTARIWDAATGEEKGVLRGHENGVEAAAFNLNGSRIVTASSDKTARVWDAISATEIAILRGHSGIVQSAAFSPDDLHIVTASEDRTARVWDSRIADLSSEQLLREICGHLLPGLSKLSRSEMRLAGYADGTPEVDVCAQ